MTGYARVRAVPPHKRPLPADPKTKEPRPPFRIVEHVRYGQGKLVTIVRSDCGDHVAVVRFSDGAERSLQLRQQYWVSDITSLIPARQPVPKPKVKATSDADESEGDGVGGEAEEIED